MGLRATWKTTAMAALLTLVGHSLRRQIGTAMTVMVLVTTACVWQSLMTVVKGKPLSAAMHRTALPASQVFPAFLPQLVVGHPLRERIRSSWRPTNMIVVVAVVEVAMGHLNRVVLPLLALLLNRRPMV